MDILLSFSAVHTLFRLLALLFPKGSQLKKNIEAISWAAAHRGIMHWPTTVLFLTGLSCVLIYFVGYGNDILTNSLFAIVFGITIGMFSHILYDIPSGTIALFAPFTTKRYGCRIITTRGLLDVFVIRTLNLVGIFILLEKIFG